MGVSAALAGGGLGLAFMGNIMKGQGQDAADQYQAERSEQQAQIARTAAAQTDTQLRENLNTTLENISATRAAQGGDPTSPTTAALVDRTAMMGDRARSIRVGNIMAQAEQDEADATFLRQSGDYALSTAWLGAAGGALSDFSKMKFA